MPSEAPVEASAGGATVNGGAPEVPGQCQHALLPTGSAAITVGLTSCYCSGRLGTVLAWHPDRGRYKVPLQDGRVLLLPMEHLVQSAVATTIPPLRVHQAASSWTLRSCALNVGAPWSVGALRGGRRLPMWGTGTYGK